MDMLDLQANFVKLRGGYRRFRADEENPADLSLAMPNSWQYCDQITLTKSLLAMSETSVD